MALYSIYKFIGNFLKTKYVYQLLVHCACHKVCSENCNWLKSWGGGPSGITPLNDFPRVILGSHSCLEGVTHAYVPVTGKSLMSQGSH